jgi:hypothetical protein
MCVMVALGLTPVVTGYGQSMPQLRHDQIKNEQKAERDMARGNYQAAKQHQRRTKADEQVRQADENQRIEHDQRSQQRRDF